MRCLVRFQLVALFALTAPACGDSDSARGDAGSVDASHPGESAPLADCRASSLAQCCLHSDCEDDLICDHNFFCGLGPDGEVTCSSGSGTRRCLPRCESAECGEGTSCEAVEISQGTDYSESFEICRPTPEPPSCASAEPDSAATCNNLSYCRASCSEDCDCSCEGVPGAGKGCEGCEGCPAECFVYTGCGDTGCPDPSDPGVGYVSQDFEQCAALLFDCVGEWEGWTLFSDECGCGCLNL